MAVKHDGANEWMNECEGGWNSSSSSTTKKKNHKSTSKKRRALKSIKYVPKMGDFLYFSSTLNTFRVWITMHTRGVWETRENVLVIVWILNLMLTFIPRSFSYLRAHSLPLPSNTHTHTQHGQKCRTYTQSERSVRDSITLTYTQESAEYATAT